MEKPRSRSQAKRSSSQKKSSYQKKVQPQQYDTKSQGSSNFISRAAKSSYRRNRVKHQGPSGRKNSWIIFLKQNRDKIRDEGFEGFDVLKEATKRYNNLTEKELDKYFDLAEKDRIRYERQMDEYKRDGYFSEEEDEITRSNQKIGYRSKDNSQTNQKQNSSKNKAGRRVIDDMDSESTQDQDEHQLRTRPPANKSKNYNAKNKIEEVNEAEVTFG